MTAMNLEDVADLRCISRILESFLHPLLMTIPQQQIFFEPLLFLFLREFNAPSFLKFQSLLLKLKFIKYILSHTLKSIPYCTRFSDYVNFLEFFI